MTETKADAEAAFEAVIGSYQTKYSAKSMGAHRRVRGCRQNGQPSADNRRCLTDQVTKN
jgi:hypothetical protein